jgi:polygalacturonase
MNVYESSPFDITRYGAASDRSRLSTPAIQAAVDDCAKNGGGTVYCPPGDYLTGTVLLQSNVTLYLSAGCTLWGSTDLADYAGTAPDNPFTKYLIAAIGRQNVSIMGEGAIDGQGEAFWEKTDKSTLLDNEYFLGGERAGWGEPLQHFYSAKPRYSRMIYFERCSGCLIEGVKLLNSPCWCLNLCGCENMRIRGVTIDAPLYGPNTDGIDVDSCSRVRISDCSIRTGDDAIVLKSIGMSGMNAPCRDIAVTNCVLTTPCNAFKLGTESAVGFENIAFSNSVVVNEDTTPRHKSLGGIVIESTDGARVRNIMVSNIAMVNVSAPIFIYLGARGRKFPWGSGGSGEPFVPGSIRDVMLSNISAVGADITSSVTGMPGCDIENVSMSGVHIEYAGGQPVAQAEREVPERPKVYPETTIYGKGAAGGLYIRHAKGLALSRLWLYGSAPDGRPPLILDDVKEADIAGLRTSKAASGEPDILLRRCGAVNLYGCNPGVTYARE